MLLIYPKWALTPKPKLCTAGTGETLPAEGVPRREVLEHLAAWLT